MTETPPIQKSQKQLDALSEALDSGTGLQARRILNALHPAETAHLLESLPLPQRMLVWKLVNHDDDGAILLEVGDEVRVGLIRSMDNDALLAATEGLELDDLADLFKDLPDAVTAEVLSGMDKQYRQRLETVLSYHENTAGGLMNTDTATIRSDVTLDVVLRYLRIRGELPIQTDSLFVVDRYETYLGILPLSEIVTQDPDTIVFEIMDSSVEGIPALTADSQVASLFEDRDLLSAAVIDEHRKLLGRITVDDVVDVIREEAEHSAFSMAGLPEEEDIFAPVAPSARRRAIWLGINMLTAFIAAWVISLFQDTLEKVVALAVLMPIVASMGGIAGGQTLTLVIRGLALDQVTKRNSRNLLIKELAVGALNGFVWALIVAALAALWFQNLELGGIIGIALLINLLCAAFAGVSIPLFLHKTGIDPAIAGGVVLTTVTDVVGFLAFLGLATVVLR